MGELEQRRSELFSKISATLGAKPSAEGRPGFFSGRFAELPYWLLLIPIVILAAWVRTRNLGLLAGKYLIELDSYLWYRYAKTIVETGSLPAIDTVRYVPIGVDTSLYKFFSYTLAYFYKIAHAMVPSLPQITWHVYYPVVVTLLSLPFFFLFVRKISNAKVAAIATALLVVIPAYIQRTSAGFADHEAMGMLWMFLSLAAFAYAWTEKDWKKSILLGAASGLFAAFMAGTWGGFVYLTMTVGLFLLATLLFSKVSRGQYAGFAAFYVTLTIIYPPIRALSYFSWIKSQESALILFPLVVVAAYWASTKLPRLARIFEHTDKYLPRQALVTLVLLAVGMIIAQITGIVDIASTYQSLTRADPNRWTTTVAENASPFFFGGGGWWDSFGWLFLLAFAGAISVTMMIFKNREHGIFDLKNQKFAYVAGLIYAIFFTGFIFGRYNSGGRFQSLVGFFSKYYIAWLLLSLTAFLLLYLYVYYKNNELFAKIFTGDKWPLIFIFVFFNFSLIVSRVLVRLIFGLSPALAIIAAWFIVLAFQKVFGNNKTKIVAVALALFAIFSFYSAAVQTAGINRSMGSMVPGQWEGAMDFLRDNTPVGSVVTHWWDYGHMTTAIAERRAVTDGGNLMSWNHASGRYFLTGKDKTSTLEYLASHSVNYTLISSQEIGKYYAFSLIGSDESLDRLSTLGFFGMQGKREARDGDLAAYGGQWTLDADMQAGDTILARGDAQINGFTLLIKGKKISEVKAYVIDKGQQLAFDVSCLYVHKYDSTTQRFIYGKRNSFAKTENAIDGCLVVVPFVQDGQVSDQGAAFWLSGKVWDTNFARLYMYGEDDKNFQLVYTDTLPLSFYNGQPIGPIKIWEVQYPEGVKTDPKYLEPSPYG
jgi:asparagine N-glycosylation enzyme membrane subunit Stt3